MRCQLVHVTAQGPYQHGVFERPNFVGIAVFLISFDLTISNLKL
jgi:hypothetical protein